MERKICLHLIEDQIRVIRFYKDFIIKVSYFDNDSSSNNPVELIKYNLDEIEEEGTSSSIEIKEVIKNTKYEVTYSDKNKDKKYSYTFEVTPNKEGFRAISNETNEVIFSEYDEKVEIKEEEKDFSLALLEGHQAIQNDNKFQSFVGIKVDKNDCIYGLGDKAAFVNRKGYDYVQYNADDPSSHNETYKSLYKSINFLVIRHDNGTKNDVSNTTNYVGMYFPTTYKAFFDLACYKEDLLFFGSKEQKEDEYILFLPVTSSLKSPLKDILSRYNLYLGSFIVPNLKMLGFIQSRWGYKTEEEVYELIDKFRELKLPLDCINLDIDYMIKYKVYTVDKEKFPNMKKLTSYAAKKKVGLFPIIDPAVKKEDGYSVYDEMKEKNLFALDSDLKDIYYNEVWPGVSAYPNYFDSKTREYITKLTNKFLNDYNFVGIWTDMNEPASFNGLLPYDVKFYCDKPYYEDDLNNNDAGSSINKHLNQGQIHNVYATYMTKAIYDAFVMDNKRPMVISRAAFAPSRLFTTVWNGDNQSLYSHLEASLPQIATLSICGLPFNGVDIGGFGNEGKRELLIRWFEANLFSPFYRDHATINSRFQEPYAFDKECLDISRKYMKLHYVLIPQIFELLERNSRYGDSVVSPLFVNYENDFKAREISDEIMLGDNLLLAPIVKQGTYERIVYFPGDENTIWYDLLTSKKYVGGRSYIVNMELDQCGLYVRNNSYLRLGTSLEYTVDDINKEVFVNIDMKDTESCFTHVGNRTTIDELKKVTIDFTNNKLSDGTSIKVMTLNKLRSFIRKKIMEEVI